MSLFDIFKEKTVLVTGHTGFKGSWLSIWLNILGARVVGLSKDVPTNPSNYEASKVHQLLDDCMSFLNTQQQYLRMIYW